MEDYRPNSHRFNKEQEKNKPEKKKIEKVVSGKVKVKTNEMRKLTDVFISEDIKNVKSYVLYDVLVPTIKKAIVDAVTDGINMIFLGKNGSHKSSTSSKISYKNFYDNGSSDYRHENSSVRSGLNYDNVILDTRGEAEEVLDRMEEIIDTYRFVSISDLCDLLGVECKYTDNKYGWTSLSRAEVVRVRDGYLLKLPRAVPID